MENIYQIDLDKLKYAKKEFKDSAVDLEDMKEIMTEKVDELCGNGYQGMDAFALQIAFSNFMENKYTTMMERIEKIGGILSDGLDEGRTCKDYCQHFISILSGEFPGIIMGGENIRGKLFCDMEKIETTRTSCQDVADSKTLIEKGMDDIDTTLSGLRKVSFDYQTKTNNVREACKQLERLESYSTALSTYSGNVENLDSTLKTKFDECYDENTISDDAYKKRKYADVEENLDLFISLIEKPNETLTVYEREELQRLTERLVESGNVEAMKTVVQKINEKNVEDWGNEDAQISAAVWKYAFEQEKTEVLEVMLSEMTEVSYGDVYISYESEREVEKVPCTAYISVEKVEAILSCLDSIENGEAYFSLSRWEKFAAQKVCVKRGETVCDDNEMPQFHVEKGTDGMQVTITYGETEKTLGAVDMNKVFGESGERTLRKLGFSEEDILNLKCSVYEDEDIVFMEKLAKANSVEAYADVFQENPYCLSDYARAGLYLYAQSLWSGAIPYDEETAMVQVADIDLTNYTAFMNGMLYYTGKDILLPNGGRDIDKNDYSMTYLAILVTMGENSLEYQQSIIEVCYQENEDSRNLLAKYKLNADMTVQHESLIYYMENGGILYDTSEHLFRVQNWIDVDEKEESVLLYDIPPYISFSDNGEDYMEDLFPITYLKGNDQLNCKKVGELNFARKEADRFNEAQFEKVVADLTKKIMSSKVKLSPLEDAGKYIVEKGIEYAQEKKELDEEIDRCYNDLENVYFRDTVVSQGVEIVGEGMYDPRTLMRTIQFETDGYSFLAEDREAVVQHMDALMSGDTLDSDNKKLKDAFETWFGGEKWETEISKEKAREELYLFWTGKNPDGTKGNIHDIDIVRYGNYIRYAEKFDNGINIEGYEDYDALTEIYEAP